MAKFKIAGEKNGKPFVKPRIGTIIDICGVKAGVHLERERKGIWDDGRHWTVTHLPTGLIWGRGDTRDSAIACAMRLFPQLKEAVKKGKKTLRDRKIKYPVNR